VATRFTRLPARTDRVLPSAARVRGLDGLRALAVLLVFAHHINGQALPGGFIAVDLFFVLSGYLITSLLLREREAIGTVSLRSFYARRALRLYPALIVFVFTVTPIALRDHLGLPLKDGLASLTYVEDLWWNYSGHVSLVLHTWSLSVEEQFYVVWPVVLIVMLARGWNPRIVVWVLVVASIGVTYAIYRAHLPRLSVIQILPTSHVAELGSGILLALAQQRGAGRVLLRVSGAVVGVAAVAALLVAEFVLPPRWWAFPAGTLACWPAVAHLALHPESRLSRLFSARVPVWLGERSYGFYLWHFPIIVLLTRHGFHSYGEAAIALPLALIATCVSWRFVETPFLRRKARFERACPAGVGRARRSGLVPSP
jgi:peptidoglycan/LPS O-acetylase OafA/YrhL